MRDEAPIETTINLRKITKNDPKRWKAKFAIRRIKKLISKQFRKEANIKISVDLNTYILKNGMTNIPQKVRVRVEKVTDETDANKVSFNLDLVETGSFNNLKTVRVEE